MELHKKGNKDEIKKAFKKAFGENTKLGKSLGFNESLFIKNFLNYNQLFEADGDKENTITDK